MPENEKKDRSQLLLGAVIGLMVSLITSSVAIVIQYQFNNREKQVQLYLDEKKDFVLACDDYLKQYRQWRELVSYCVQKNGVNEKSTLEYKNSIAFIEGYKKWKNDIDFAYTKIFLLSDNEFGMKTMQVSTILHNSLQAMITGEIPVDKRENLFRITEDYFFENWLQLAQEEIFKYNSGDRRQKSLREFRKEQIDRIAEDEKNDSLDNKMYDGLSKAYDYLKKQDSLKGRSSKAKIPQKDE